MIEVETYRQNLQKNPIFFTSIMIVILGTIYITLNDKPVDFPKISVIKKTKDFYDFSEDQKLYFEKISRKVVNIPNLNTFMDHDVRLLILKKTFPLLKILENQEYDLEKFFLIFEIPKKGHSFVSFLESAVKFMIHPEEEYFLKHYEGSRIDKNIGVLPALDLSDESNNSFLKVLLNITTLSELKDKNSIPEGDVKKENIKELLDKIEFLKLDYRARTDMREKKLYYQQTILNAKKELQRTRFNLTKKQKNQKELESCIEKRLSLWENCIKKKNSYEKKLTKLQEQRTVIEKPLEEQKQSEFFGETLLKNSKELLEEKSELNSDYKNTLDEIESSIEMILDLKSRLTNLKAEIDFFLDIISSSECEIVKKIKELSELDAEREKLDGQVRYILRKIKKMLFAIS